MQGKKTLLEEFHAKGHQNVRANHKTTLEFTKSPDLTPRGNCILAVGSSIAPVDFKDQTKALLRSPNNFLLEMEVDSLVERLTGFGHPDLSLTSDEEMVFRKSGYISGRTVLVRCDKASVDLNPEFRKRLKDETKSVEARLYLLG